LFKDIKVQSDKKDSLETREPHFNAKSLELLHNLWIHKCENICPSLEKLAACYVKLTWELIVALQKHKHDMNAPNFVFILSFVLPNKLQVKTLQSLSKRKYTHSREPIFSSTKAILL
jgi:thiol-disulfide isomerase/thioredoxin